MKIVVLNGSPKGPLSVTMQYVSYVAKRHPGHELRVFHVAQRVHGLEKDRRRFEGLQGLADDYITVWWPFFNGLRSEEPYSGIIML